MNDFYQEEIRDDYLITTKYKKIWDIELKILSEIIRICEKSHIQYFVYGGTLLGAIRHKGFIPWDDDMDVGMLRQEYEKFLKCAERELQEGFCFQKSEMLGDIYEGFSRIRYTNSTGIIYRDRQKNCNHGIFVDIFPLDNIPDNERKAWIQRKKISILSGMVYYHVYYNQDSRHKLLGKILSLVHKVSVWEQLIFLLKKECMKYNAIESEKVGILSCDPYDEKCYWYRTDIEKTIEVPFENITVKVPIGYERCLKIGYGDYRKFPPIEERGKWHQNIYFDPDHPYTYYEERELLFLGENQ